MKISVVSGGFDPIHSGHIAYINSAKKYGDILFVALNSDDWLSRKKGQPFMCFNERKIVLESIKSVNEVIAFNDDDGSCIDALKQIKDKYPDEKIIFCNGEIEINLMFPKCLCQVLNLFWSWRRR